MRFTKGHGTANDFVVLPDPDGEVDLSERLVRALCDRRRGVGADGVLRVVLSAAMPGYEHLAPEARWFMDYRNADGGLAEMCGNGVRVFARYLAERGYATSSELRVGTRDGIKAVVLRDDGAVTVDMGTPRFDGAGPLPDGGVFVSMGNPHVVLFTDDVRTAPVHEQGAAVEAATPGGTNVEYVSVRGPHELVMRVWERGVGETQACGTGACAVVVAAARTERAARTASVQLPGGLLHVQWNDDDHVQLTGPAELVADGELRSAWLEANR